MHFLVRFSKALNLDYFKNVVSKFFIFPKYLFSFSRTMLFAYFEGMFQEILYIII